MKNLPQGKGNGYVNRNGSGYHGYCDINGNGFGFGVDFGYSDRDGNGYGYGEGYYDGNGRSYGYNYGDGHGYYPYSLIIVSALEMLERALYEELT